MRARLILGLCFLCAQTMAEDADPPAGFLEFLGTMVEQDGELVDPLTFEVEAEREVAREVEEVVATRPSKHEGKKIESVSDSEVDESNE